MFIREVKYYFMTINQLNKEVMKLRQKLESEEDFDVKMKYLDALTDIIKTIIRKNRNNDEVMREIRIELRKLQRQAQAAYESVEGS